MTRRSICLGIT